MLSHNLRRRSGIKKRLRCPLGVTAAVFAHICGEWGKPLTARYFHHFPQKQLSNGWEAKKVLGVTAVESKCKLMVWNRSCSFPWNTNIVKGIYLKSKFYKTEKLVHLRRLWNIPSNENSDYELKSELKNWQCDRDETDFATVQHLVCWGWNSTALLPKCFLFATSGWMITCVRI